MLAGSELEAAADRLVRRGSHLVGSPAAHELLATERHPHVRPEELVRRADQHVAAPGGDVDRPVRPVVHCVDPGERARVVRELDDPLHVWRRPDRVRGGREGNHPGLVGQLRLEVVVIETEVISDVHEVDDDPDIALDLQPGCDVRVVVEARHEHLVARPQRPRKSACKQEVQRSHALAERNLARVTVHERRCALVGASDERVGAL